MTKATQKGIATAITMGDFERFVRGSLKYPDQAESFDFAELKKAWGLNNNLMLTLDEFQRLMDLFSAPETHLRFSAAVRAALIDSKGPLAVGLTEIPSVRVQHVAQALLPMASDIFADAVNSSMFGNTKGVWAGFLPEDGAEAALRADGRNGAFLLRLSDKRPGQIVVSYLRAPEAMPISLAQVLLIGAPRIAHEILELSILVDCY